MKTQTFDLLVRTESFEATPAKKAKPSRAEVKMRKAARASVMTIDERLGGMFAKAEDDARQIIEALPRLTLRGMQEIARQIDGPTLVALLGQMDDKTAAVVRERQRAIAKLPRGPRPNKLRDDIMAKMRAARKDHQTLNQFIAAAIGADDWPVHMKWMESEEKFELSSADLQSPPMLVAHSTLESWWTDSMG